MKNNADVNYFDSIFRSGVDSFMASMDMLSLIDIGIIEDVDVNGRATVLTSRTESGNTFRLTDVEVIFPGNRLGAFTVNGCGCTGLIFGPKTIVPNIRDAKINGDAPTYSKQGVKVLPVSNGRNLLVNAGFNADGTLFISTEGYQLCIRPEEMSLVTDAGMFIDVDNQNNIELYRRNETSGILDYKITNDGIISEFTNSQATSIYKSELLDNGTYTLSHLQPQGQGDPKLLNQIAVTDDGKITLKASDKVTISVGPNGDIKITTEGKLELSADGKLDIQSKDDITIKSGAGHSVSINGNNLKVDS